MPYQRSATIRLLAACSFFCLLLSNVSFSESTNFRGNFEELYKAYIDKIWVDHGFDSDSIKLVKTSEFNALISAGPAIVPFLIEKLDDKNGHPPFVCKALSVITHKSFGYLPTGKKERSAKSKVELWKAWWRGGGGEASIRYSEFLNAWKEIKSAEDPIVLVVDKHVYSSTLDGRFGIQTERTKAGWILRGIEALGIEVLPLVIAELEKGNNEFVYVAQSLMGLEEKDLPGSSQNYGGMKERVVFLVSYWKKNKSRWELPPRDIEEKTGAQNIRS